MDMNKFPTQSREFLNESLHDYMRAAETESPLFAQEVINHLVYFGLKSGRLFGLGVSPREFERRNARGRSQGSGGASVGSRVPGDNGDRFVFDPKANAKQSLPSVDSRLCYACANAMKKQGKLVDGEQPPDVCFFDSFVELQKHKRSGKCLGRSRK